MFKFHQISTQDFEPISHDKRYLFDLYDKIINLLNLNLGGQAGFVLAKPFRNGHFIEWYSNYPDLKNVVTLDESGKAQVYRLYWDYRENVNKLIAKLKNTKDADNNNWALIFEKVFNETDNIIFYNGSNFVIVWGWKFFNHSIYKPQIIDPLMDQNPIIAPSVPTNNPSPTSEVEESIPVNPIVAEEPIPSAEAPPVPVLPRDSFIEFLRWFASNYWWLLLLLLAIIILLLIYWGFVNHRYIQDLNVRQGKLEHVIDTICK
jgi:hypothetical protein